MFKTVIRRFLKLIGMLELLVLWRDSLRLPKNSVVLIHIGKCGGSALRRGLQSSDQYKDIPTFHCKKPPFRKDLKYIIVARGPISRLVSAYRWRTLIVVKDGAQRKRYKGEYAALLKYGSLNSLAEALYDEAGKSNPVAQKDIKCIEHIREDIAFHLSALLSKVSPGQIQAVLMQENLDEDIYRVFGYKNEHRVNHNLIRDSNEELSPKALRNLLRFFHKDYEMLMRLYCWEKIEHDVICRAI